MEGCFRIMPNFQTNKLKYTEVYTLKYTVSTQCSLQHCHDSQTTVSIINKEIMSTQHVLSLK